MKEEILFLSGREAVTLSIKVQFLLIGQIRALLSLEFILKLSLRRKQEMSVSPERSDILSPSQCGMNLQVTIVTTYSYHALEIKWHLIYPHYLKWSDCFPRQTVAKLHSNRGIKGTVKPSVKWNLRAIICVTLRRFCGLLGREPELFRVWIEKKLNWGIHKKKAALWDDGDKISFNLR